jgi:AcrR family transcriptional regulator
MRRVARELGIKAPSLYKHFSSRADIEGELVADAMADLGDATHRAIHEAGDGSALMSLLWTYRANCIANPALYLLATQGTFNRDRLPPGLEQWAGNPFYVVTGDASLAQALWSFAHGMVVLEMNDRFAPGANLDDTWLAGGMAFERNAAHPCASSSEVRKQGRTSR